MLPDDLLANIQRLPLDEKVILLKTLIRTVSEEMLQQSREAAADPHTTRAREAYDVNAPLPPFEDLQGILATGAPIPAAYDWEDDYTDYLTKKYT